MRFDLFGHERRICHSVCSQQFLGNLEENPRSLPKAGIAITQKAAELFDLSTGDHISLYDENQKEWKVEVKEIVKNYLGSFI